MSPMTLDQQAREARTALHAAASMTDPDALLARIEGWDELVDAPASAWWRRRAVAFGVAVVAALVAVVVVPGLLRDDALEIDDPGIVGDPPVHEWTESGSWPPPASEVASVDGWIRLPEELAPADAAAGTVGLVDVVTLADRFIVVRTDGQVWESGDGVAWRRLPDVRSPAGVRSETAGWSVGTVATDGRVLAAVVDTWDDTTGELTATVVASTDARTWRAVAEVDPPDGWAYPLPQMAVHADGSWALLLHPSPAGGDVQLADQPDTRVLASDDGLRWRDVAAIDPEWDAGRLVATPEGFLAGSGSRTSEDPGRDWLSSDASAGGWQPWAAPNPEPDLGRTAPMLGGRYLVSTDGAAAWRLHRWSGGWVRQHLVGEDAGVMVTNVVEVDGVAHAFGTLPDGSGYGGATVWRRVADDDWQVVVRADDEVSVEMYAAPDIATYHDWTATLGDATVVATAGSGGRTPMFVHRPVTRPDAPSAEPVRWDPSACSAAGLDPEVSALDAELPPGVVATRQLLAAAAASCDFEGLAGLSGDQSPLLNGPFDDISEAGPDVGDQVLALERARVLGLRPGPPVLRSLRLLLDREPRFQPSPGGSEPGLYAWPTVPGGALTPELEAWVHETGAYTPEQTATWEGRYQGYILMIDERGTWTWFQRFA